jgi:hypothetical protein
MMAPIIMSSAKREEGTVNRRMPPGAVNPLQLVIGVCCGLLVAGCTATGQVEESILPATAPQPTGSSPEGWSSLFDGQTLRGWQILTEGPFSGHGTVEVKDGAIVLERGGSGTGIRWQGEFPREDYEVALEGMRVNGMDFFCGMTFPVGDSPCTLILGGWGGSVVGLSNIDGAHAAENQTTQGMNFENGRWYQILLRVTRERIQVWIDEEQKINLERADHQFDVWYEQEPACPFGFATWETTGALRNIRLRALAT